ncbi:hypothetical protein SAMN05216315_1324 [Nitrosospira sp. Nsp18]|uniref:hypothetical protein n=1 Tax=Nitrosospira sp. Nsp18 TaxID=1855334 RepID=UPI0008884DF3|nr:hypothetical protein [Nitrosospira sp. Nsp18]SDA27045.1 hypothetical protein SAMN05216315_1324 [Nitrosospira sp. Nsp18]
MANANSTPIETPLDRLKVEDCWWGKFYQGTQADLIGAGLVKLEWFPGPGTAKTATRIAIVDGEMKVLPLGRMATREQQEKGLVKIFQASKNVFKVHIAYSREQIERENFKREIERQHADKKRALEAAAKSPGEFLHDQKRVIKGLLEVVFNHFRRADNGFHYSKEVIEQANDLICDLIELAEDGKVYFDQKRHQHFMDDVEEKAVKAHPEFSAFMAATLAIGKAAA